MMLHVRLVMHVLRPLCYCMQLNYSKVAIESKHVQLKLCDTLH